MTSVRFTTIKCDNWRCDQSIHSSGSAKDVRLDAPYGWVWQWDRRYGGWVDLCPIHSVGSYHCHGNPKEKANAIHNGP